MSESTELASLKVKVEHLEGKVDEIAADLKVIRDTLAEIRGGKKALWLLVGAASSFGALVTWLLQHVALK